MDFYNYPYMVEPDKTIDTTISIILFVMAFGLIAYYYFKYKKQDSNNKNIKDVFGFIVFQPGIAVIIVILMGVNAIKENEIHKYEVSPKFLTIEDRHIKFTVNPQPEGKLHTNDIYSASLFVHTIKAEYKIQENLCRIIFDTTQNNEKIKMVMSMEEHNCQSTAKALFNKINYSKLNNYPKVKNIQPIYFSYNVINNIK